MLILFGTAAEAQTLQPIGWDSDIKLREAADLNPNPHIVEVQLDARIAKVKIGPGNEVDAWTYNGGIPGPLIRVRAGDRLIVHFTNHLPQPTTVHWHGVRVPIEMDGVPGISQPDVKTGESFTYDFIAPDAGLFWYHPHVMSALQVGYGLYGALLVEDPNDGIGVRDELVLVVSDIALNDDNTLQPPENAGQLGMAFGLEGNHILVNGRENPTLTARSGAPQRWRIVNTAKSKYFQLTLDGDDSSPFTVIGGDGGLQEYAIKQDTLVIAPGERIDAIVTPRGARGAGIVVRSFPFNRGYGSEYLPIVDLFTIAISNDAAITDALPEISLHREIPPTDKTGATAAHMDITLEQLDARNIEYRINGIPNSKIRPFQAFLGETQIWTITNRTKWSHPIHLHGFFFQVLDAKGEPVRPMAWKDTVDVPFESTLQFVVRYDDRPGVWMFHCHILDHAEGGLMTTVEVRPRELKDSKDSPKSHHTH